MFIKEYSMRDFNGKTIKPLKDHRFGIYGIKELLGTFLTKPEAELALANLQAPPDGSARTYAKAFTVRKLKA